MKTRILIVLMVVMGGAGCAANRTQRVPTVSGPGAAVAPAAAPQRDIMKEVGDTTWNVVSAPARLVVPKKEPAKAPEVYEAPSAVFMRRNYGEEDGAASAPSTRP